MLGVFNNEPWRLDHLVPRLPFGTFLTLKRCFVLLCSIGESLRAGQGELALGSVAQGLRWIAMHLHCPSQPELAWGLTYLPDPKSTICIGREVSSDMLNESLQDPRQLTALLGLKKDRDSIRKASKGGGQQPALRPPRKEYDKDNDTPADDRGKGDRGKGCGRRNRRGRGAAEAAEEA